MPNDDGYTPEGLEDARREAYMEVLEVFRPIVLGNLRRKIEEEIAATSFTDEDMREYCLSVRELAFARYGSAEIADRHMREAARRFVIVEQVPADARPPMLCNEDIVDDAFDSFVASWLDVLVHLATGEEGRKTLDASLLGIDMLPGTMPECAKCGGPRFVWTPYSETQARQVLRFVRSTLRDDERIPDEVIALFALHGVSVSNL